jgi:hypothetical protein
MRLLMVLAVCAVTLAAAQDSCSVDDNQKVDCVQFSQGACQAADCCWSPAGQNSVRTRAGRRRRRRDF